MSLAAVASGADGLMLEVHTDPEMAKSDKDQALTPKQFSIITKKVLR
jgi:3-deoxy-7-phosphoheptulonate synthase